MKIPLYFKRKKDILNLLIALEDAIFLQGGVDPKEGVLRKRVYKKLIKEIHSQLEGMEIKL